ncbi:MAG TPA: M67 family metallopeptidase [Terriglobia bacterium]|nr:M67 family metallopeptidase [Terriglobia bacterium]
MHLTLAPGLMDRIVRHAAAALPQEGCGLIAGSRGAAERFIPMTNRLASATSFDMEPSELIATLRSLRESGESLLAIYHSHPRGPAEPSPRDIDRAYYPEAAQIIVSLASPENPVVRGFRIVDAQAIEIELRVIV